MSEDVARVLGANGHMVVKINGKDCQSRALGIGELAELNRDCLERYKKSYLKTFSDNREMIDGDYNSIIIEQMEKAAKWDIDAIPKKKAYDPESIKLSDDLKRWLLEKLNLDAKSFKGKDGDKRLRGIAAFALDSETLSIVEYNELTASDPKGVKVPYVAWWMTGDYDGMLSTIWVCFRPTVSREEIAKHIGADKARMTEISREIERLTAPAMGNT